MVVKCCCFRYHRMALKYHPDKNRTCDGSFFSDIAEAYDVLSSSKFITVIFLNDQFSLMGNMILLGSLAENYRC
jgi:hypothetical protein